MPFRSVASRILRSLSREAREIVQLDVLRPPTFEQLAKTLRAAKRAGQPYHVLHFDGHGTYMDLPEPAKIADFLKRLGMVTLGAPRAGQHGYLLFENPQADEKASLVDGPSLGKLLVETGVPVLVLNACQSAFAEAPEQPADAERQPAAAGRRVRLAGAGGDGHGRRRRRGDALRALRRDRQALRGRPVRRAAAGRHARRGRDLWPQAARRQPAARDRRPARQPAGLAGADRLRGRPRLRCSRRPRRAHRLHLCA